jgi:hypothetical protein
VSECPVTFNIQPTGVDPPVVFTPPITLIGDHPWSEFWEQVSRDFNMRKHNLGDSREEIERATVQGVLQDWWDKDLIRLPPETEPEEKKVPPITSITFRTVLQALRDTLEQAERGELRSVAIAYETTADGTGHRIGFGRLCWRTALIGELEVAKMSIMIADDRLKTPDQEESKK